MTLDPPGRLEPDRDHFADSAAAQRAARLARRAYIRTNHPDAGGDSERFIHGLGQFDETQTRSNEVRAQDEYPPRPVRVTIAAHQPWPVSLTTVLLRYLRRSRQPPRVR